MASKSKRPAGFWIAQTYLGISEVVVSMLLLLFTVVLSVAALSAFLNMAYNPSQS
jgi:hypothetical protein